MYDSLVCIPMTSLPFRIWSAEVCILYPEISTKRYKVNHRVLGLEPLRDTLFLSCWHYDARSNYSNTLASVLWPHVQSAILSPARISCPISFLKQWIKIWIVRKCKDGFRFSCVHLTFCHEYKNEVANGLACNTRSTQRVKALCS